MSRDNTSASVIQEWYEYTKVRHNTEREKAYFSKINLFLELIAEYTIVEQKENTPGPIYVLIQASPSLQRMLETLMQKLFVWSYERVNF